MKSLSKAEKLLYSLGITSPADIDLEAIAWTQNVLVKTRSLEGCEARIFGKGDVAIISVNENSRSTRQRFSIAHELGHWNNDRGMNFYCSSKDLEIGFKNSKLAERLANYFAADLLFPGFLFKPIVKQTPELTWDVIKDVSNDFNTSLTATAFRFIDSNEYPVILAVYNSNFICQPQQHP
jgi:Zn-dependent peptidase ImmA (M78 family)